MGSDRTRHRIASKAVRRRGWGTDLMDRPCIYIAATCFSRVHVPKACATVDPRVGPEPRMLFPGERWSTNGPHGPTRDARHRLCTAYSVYASSFERANTRVRSLRGHRRDAA